VAHLERAAAAAHATALAPPGRNIVLMAGDGINDAIALAQADVSVAMGSGTAIAMESADIVIMHSHLGVLDALLDLSTAALHRITTNFAWAATYNAIAMPLAGGALFPLLHRLAIPPALAGVSELLSSVPVVLGSLLLYRFRSAGAQWGRGTQ
jgi:Cu+-exporting ATPase